MTLKLTPLHPLFAAEASGFDLTQPLGLGEVKQINAAMNRRSISRAPSARSISA